MIAFCRAHKIDLVVVGPEGPMGEGIVDDLAAAGIKAFGASRAAAQLETSKGFTKDLCRKYGIPTAGYERFTAAAPAKAYVRAQGRADRGQGRRACRRQGRGGGADAWPRRRRRST